MFERIVATTKGCAAGLTLVLNTLVFVLAMVPFALAKLIVPAAAVRRAVDRALNTIAGAWIGVNNAWMAAVGRTRWDVQVADGLRMRGWYLVSSNHASWVDILVLQKVFNGRIPLLKFFLKQELIWVPVMGLAWWALDFPFMRRGGGANARKDLKAAREACEKFRLLPTSVMSFAEGTRFTTAKHADQQSPYQHLLQPKSGGLGMALSTIGELFTGLVDVTLVYPNGTPSFVDAMSGRLGNVVVVVRQQPIPPDLFKNGARQRAQLQSWLDGVWQSKDALIAQIKATPPNP